MQSFYAPLPLAGALRPSSSLGNVDGIEGANVDSDVQRPYDNRRVASLYSSATTTERSGAFRLETSIEIGHQSRSIDNAGARVLGQRHSMYPGGGCSGGPAGRMISSSCTETIVGTVVGTQVFTQNRTNVFGADPTVEITGRNGDRNCIENSSRRREPSGDISVMIGPIVDESSQADLSIEPRGMESISSFSRDGTIRASIDSVSFDQPDADLGTGQSSRDGMISPSPAFSARSDVANSSAGGTKIRAGRVIWSHGMESMSAGSTPFADSCLPSLTDADRVAIALHRKAKAGGRSAAYTSEVARLASRLSEGAHDCSARRLANASWALAKMARRDDSLMAVIADAATIRIAEFKSMELAMTAWSWAALAIRNVNFCDVVFGQACEILCEAGTQTRANLVWAMAKTSVRHSPLLQSLLDSASSSARDFRIQELVNTAWSFARLHIHDTPFLSAVSTDIMGRSVELNAQEVANLSWACALALFADLPLLDVIGAQGARTLGDATPQEIANTAWAFARCVCSRSPIFDAMARVTAVFASTFDAQSLANVAWVWASLDIHDEPLLSAIAAASRKKIGSFNVQDVSNTSWAFARLVVRDEQLFSSLSSAALVRVRQMDGQSVSSLAWAFAHLVILNEQLFAALSRRAIATISDFDDQSLSLTAWAFSAVLVENDFPLPFQAIANTVLGRLDNYSVQHLCNTTWAFAKLLYVHSSLFDAMAQRSLFCAHQLDTQAIANIIWSFACLARFDGPLLQMISSASMLHCANFSAQEIANVAWSFARCKAQDSPLMLALQLRAVKMLGDFTSQNVANLAWAFYVLAETCRVDAFVLPAASVFLDRHNGVGTEWVDMATAAKKHGPFTGGHELDAKFEELILRPAMAELEMVMDPATSLPQAMRSFKAFLDNRQLPHLGPYYTLRVLPLLRWLPRGGNWGTTDAVSATDWFIQARGEARSARGPVATPAVRAQIIVSWASASLWFGELNIEVPGRVFTAGVPPEADEDILALLRPTFRQHGRQDHAERVALLFILATVLNACRAGTGVLDALSGTVRLYVSHFPCTSCLGVLGQFARQVPRAQLEICFDDAWEDD
eukprot:TRINITY_DN43489_c0_g1_i1.p1 TRINITY_DN43489_c0_g1~~TRINITY_DN43489_c0_g1_i1.p1  ORF type:complete len:1083 (+),score=150.64 TRINITY_DN43489_c0_g1_i1:201-3449(+)